MPRILGTRVATTAPATRPILSTLGGQTFTLAAFEKKVSKPISTLNPGESVKILIGTLPAGSKVPFVDGVNKDSPFTVQNARGYFTITANANAKANQAVTVKLVNGTSKRELSFKLLVGLSSIQSG
jgi:hypothetical protein